MSEEILKALMQLFALIVKQGGVVEKKEIEFVRNFLNQQLSESSVEEYMLLFEDFADLKILKKSLVKKSRTSVKDSVRIFAICKKINRTLIQKQKAIVCVRLFELVNVARKYSYERMTIIYTVAEVFNISKEEFSAIEVFVKNDQKKIKEASGVLQIGLKDFMHDHSLGTANENILSILWLESVDVFFLKHIHNTEVFLNGLSTQTGRIYIFASGASLRLQSGKPIYYSDIVSRFRKKGEHDKILFEAINISYQFSNKVFGLKNLSFSETQGRLVGIMGASGSGKTTLLNVLCGIENPSEGEVLINGLNLHSADQNIIGTIGYIPQDDLLIEELTVYQNLFYNAKLCFGNKTDHELRNMVNKVLNNLGLEEKMDLKVGSPQKKIISGGQRKRLNIALELIREPAVLFVDEPTSGLSSRDSENVLDLLRELSIKGKLVFVVIHQPSSDLFKMFDKILLLDEGGVRIYYGNPVESIIHFKKLDDQINSEIGECSLCGNTNQELIFNIVEKKEVDEYGRYTKKRKISPEKWEAHFLELHKPKKIPPPESAPPSALNVPGKFKQFKIFWIRDVLSKLANKQYVALNLLEAPVLGFILSYIIHYIADPESDNYIFRENDNIPIYIFMSLIVALFLALTLSAEEIFRDKKILKREHFLNLNKHSYLLAKVLILLLISALQSYLFVVVGNSILEIKGMNFFYWMALFSTAAFANLLGLNISASFNSAITIYIIIPLLIIPMMVLSGAMFSFDKLNRNIGSVKHVPLIAETMATRWTYEALMVHQFKDNEFESYFYEFEKNESEADFELSQKIPALRKVLSQTVNKYNHAELIEKDQGDL
ncbi:MAG: ATP-binding cassette domain-containing protein, partial [Bacteroidota bacterium]|nr:ATP-binding cassette domain-containing protein [Bacteroidota bacterium]